MSNQITNLPSGLAQLAVAVLLVGFTCGCRDEAPQQPDSSDQPVRYDTVDEALVRSSMLGHTIDDFRLKDFHGNAVAMSDLADHRLVVVAFLGVECPLAQLYAPRLNALAERYASRKVAFIGIDSNRQDSVRDMGNYARKFNISFPLLKDPANTVADQFKAIRTPEIFVLDRQRTVRYWGRVDNQYGVGYQRSYSTRDDLAAAIDDLLANREVQQKATPAPGCLIGRVSRTEPHGDVTYSNQVARILQTRCVRCHRTGEVAPFELATYDEVAGWAEMIREVIHQGRMPPWSASPEFGQFSNDPRLTDEEKRLIDDWVEHGVPEGDTSQLPPAVAPTGSWHIGEPDEVFFMAKEPFDVPSEGVVDYQYYVVDPGHDEDRWIQAAEARPGNRAVVHHLITFIWPPDVPRSELAPQIGFAPGMQPRVFPPGTAICLPRGAKLLFELHYTPIGTPQTDLSSVGFVYADRETVQHHIRGGMAGNDHFEIPPEAYNHKITAQHRFERDTLLLSLMPHMHLRGKSFRYDVRYPDGTRDTLLDIPRYDFNWQLWYEFSEPRFMPRGTYLNCTARFDNSSDNPVNPDPQQTVTFGLQTDDEMMIGYFTAIDAPADQQAPSPKD